MGRVDWADEEKGHSMFANQLLRGGVALLTRVETQIETTLHEATQTNTLTAGLWSLTCGNWERTIALNGIYRSPGGGKSMSGSEGMEARKDDFEKIQNMMEQPEDEIYKELPPPYNHANQ